MEQPQVTGYNKEWAKKAGREKFLKQHAHIKGSSEWWDKTFPAPEKEKEKPVKQPDQDGGSTQLKGGTGK